MAQDAPLSPPEAWLRRELKRAYLGLASLDRSIARQWAWFGWLQEGDRNTAFLKIHVAHRRQKNHIFNLQVGNQTVSIDEDMAAAAFEYFFGILGTPEAREFTISLQTIDERHFSLSDLDRPFMEDEIWAAIKQLPTGCATVP